MLLAATSSALAAVRYVDANSANPAPPYTNWATAAVTIQQAVDAAVAGDEIVTTNGLYATGGRATGTNLLVNRVAVDKPVTLHSVNGPEFTVIQGHQVPGTINGDDAIRCVYLADGANLSGFTLTNGATRAVDEMPPFSESGGGGLWCESSSAVVSNCVLVGNSAAGLGGGAYDGTLKDCTLTGNSASGGGGAASATLNTCTLTGNRAWYGGGTSGGTLNNSTLTGNSADYSGGGALSAELNNCTVTGNFARGDGGGVAAGILKNCIVYFNTAPDGANFTECDPAWFPNVSSYCCTTPMPTNGFGNITNAPLFVDAAAGNYRLRPDSPCIDAGTNLSAIVTNDLDGRPRPVDGNGDGVAAFDIGAYEYRALYVSPESPNPTPPYTNGATAARVIQDAVDAALPGDEIVVTNGVYATGGRAVGTNLLVNRVAVDKPLALRSVNGPQFTVIQGHQVPGTTNGDGAIRCVYLASGARLSGFTLTNGATRTNWEYSLDMSGGGVGCESTNAVVSNCVVAGNSAYNLGGGAFGGTVENCELTGNSARINGGGAAADSTLNNCALTGNSADQGGGTRRGTLNNCTLTGNSADWAGAGANDSTLNNCVLSGNSAGYRGGGADNCTLNNCTLTANLARAYGGGANWCMLNNCTLTGNLVTDNSGGLGFAGGANGGTLNNCILYFNTAPTGANYHNGEIFFSPPVMNYCCTTPMPTNGVGNITNAPLFVDYAGGNLRLQSNSPCINAGNNAYAAGPTDLDGNPRIVSGTVDIGAYEFQGPGSSISYAWLQRYGLPTNGSADATDADADGHTTWQEWRTGTCPTNALSVLRLLSATSDGTNVTVSWQSIAGVLYLLERSTNLASSPCFLPLASDIVGQPGTTRFTDTNAASLAPLFYRVRVEN